MSLIRRVLEQRDVTAFGPYVSDPSRIPSNAEAGLVQSGVPVSQTSSLQLSAVYACRRLLADSIASLPWDAYRKESGRRVELDPQPAFLTDPHPEAEVTDFEWKFMCVEALAMRGNFYGLITARDWREYPTKVMPLAPDSVMVERDRETGLLRYKVGQTYYPRSDILHIRLFPVAGSDVSLSPVSAAAEAIGLGLAAQQFGARWFGDGAAPSSVLESEANLTQDQVRQAQEQWISSHGGRRRPAVLTGGFKWRPISITPEESQFLETRKFQVAEIARIFGVPPHMIGDVERSTSWGTGIEQQSIGFVVYTLRPWLTRIESALSRLLPRGQYVRFNVEGLLRGDIKSRYEAYRVAREGGWMNVDEIRALEDMEPLPGGLGRGYLQPMNFAPLGYDPSTAAPDSEDGDADDTAE